MYSNQPGRRRIVGARQMVYEWLARYASGGGLAGLADRSSRPETCPHQMSAATEARVVGMRRDHPGWGPSRIVWELERAGVEPLPGRSGVYLALVRHGLVEARKRRRRREVTGGGNAAGRCSCSGYAGPLAMPVWIVLGFAAVLSTCWEHTPVGRSLYPSAVPNGSPSWLGSGRVGAR